MYDVIEVPVRIPVGKHSWSTGEGVLEAVAPIRLRQIDPEDAPVAVEMVDTHAKLRAFEGSLWEHVGATRPMGTTAFGSWQGRAEVSWGAALGRMFQREQLFLGQEVTRVPCHDEAMLAAVERVQRLADQSAVMGEAVIRRTLGPTMFPGNVMKRSVELFESFQPRFLEKTGSDTIGHCSALDRELVEEMMGAAFGRVVAAPRKARVLSVGMLDMEAIRLELARIGMGDLLRRLAMHGETSIVGLDREAVAAVKRLREPEAATRLIESIGTARTLLEQMPDEFFDEQIKAMRKGLLVVLDYVEETSVQFEEKLRAEQDLTEFKI